ncbi:DUF4198 domain-containing protein [Paenibacillus taiwanensis]|uniref:DUF4198 domain-containing protein n=1 Tax=Paenibacillus taiwanensis TaxID=401638 RepID=UPI0004008D80|nr:DUF4198 domain-containing protein [Paenibacillus taiwanensis]
MRKKLLSILIASVVAATMAIPAMAHDGWSQTHAPIVGAGEVAYVDLQLGNHSNHHASYRIEGKWSTDTTKVFATTPAGKKVDITSTLYYTGEITDTENPGMNNGYIASLKSATPGAYIISAEGDSIFKNGEVASRTLRSAKSFVAISDLPTLQRVAQLKGFNKQVTTDRAEFVPQFNPAAITPDQQVKVQLLLKGKPLADTDVSLIRRSNSEAQALKTDANGIVTFKTGPADAYLLRAKPATQEKEEGQYSSVNYEATMTYTVQNGTFKVAAEKVNPKPAVYVNGKVLDDKAVTVKNGTTMVDAAIIQAQVGAYDAKGEVSLRAAVDKTGAVLEFFPAVGGTRAAIHVYTK